MIALFWRSEFRLWLGSLAFLYWLEFCTLKKKILDKIVKILHHGLTLMQPPRSNRALTFLTEDKAERQRSNCLIFLGFHNYIELELEKNSVEFSNFNTTQQDHTIFLGGVKVT